MPTLRISFNIQGIVLCVDGIVSGVILETMNMAKHGTIGLLIFGVIGLARILIHVDNATPMFIVAYSNMEITTLVPSPNPGRRET